MMNEECTLRKDEIRQFLALDPEEQYKCPTCGAGASSGCTNTHAGGYKVTPHANRAGQTIEVLHEHLNRARELLQAIVEEH